MQASTPGASSVSKGGTRQECGQCRGCGPNGIIPPDPQFTAGLFIAMHRLPSELPLNLGYMQSPLPCAMKITKHKIGLVPPWNPECANRDRQTNGTNGGGLVGAAMLASRSEQRDCLLPVHLGSKCPSCTYWNQSHEKCQLQMSPEHWHNKQKTVSCFPPFPP
jgi:hypothetical protein